MAKFLSEYDDINRDALHVLEEVYAPLGGVRGYQDAVIECLKEKKESCSYLPPVKEDISVLTPTIRRAILAGIEKLGEMAEFYPLGGAAERLHLIDKKSQQSLPAAKLIFFGKDLLEGLIRDLQAREYLHYKLFGKQLTTPIVMMTSHIKGNHDHILDLCQKRNWYERPKDSFTFIIQPSVPVVDREGQWCLDEENRLLLKPGGHGMIWKLALDAGVFDNLFQLNRNKALIRQINNPIAGVDYGLLAFMGMGHIKEMSFGFASCPSDIQAKEGMNVIKQIDGKYALSNVEYCQINEKERSSYPSNTNLLFAHLEKLAPIIERYPFPGKLLNFRNGQARLETMMQNIGDHLQSESIETLPTYLTFHTRNKTISTTKREYVPGDPMLETPQGCFYDFLRNGRELLTEYCGMEVPNIPDAEVFLKEGPPFLFNYHPALGPLFEIIAQKIKGGKIGDGSELTLEIADLFLENLHLHGSLIIETSNVMGHLEKGCLKYSEKTGRCLMRNVTVVNESFKQDQFFEHEIKRNGSFHLILHENSLFEAENVVFKGDHLIEVPPNTHMIASQEGKTISYKSREGFWNYKVSESAEIYLEKEFSPLHAGS